MSMVRLSCAVALLILIAPSAPAQEVPKPGPEFDILKKMEGNWDLTLMAGGVEAKGSVTYKMELGGLWLTSSLECDMFGTKFTGKGLDSYDARKKKYVSVWVDSMSTGPTVMEGAYDSAKKTLTLTGEGPGMDGKPAKLKSTTEITDDNTIKFGMYMGDVKEPTFTIVYKRKK